MKNLEFPVKLKKLTEASDQMTQILVAPEYIWQTPKVLEWEAKFPQSAQCAQTKNYATTLHRQISNCNCSDMYFPTMACADKECPSVA